jgi:hypothetical protein
MNTSTKDHMREPVFSLDQVEDLLTSVTGLEAIGSFSAMMPQVGLDFDKGRELMIVGRSTNGWGEPADGANTQFTLAEIIEPSVRRGFSERSLRSSDEDPMDWVPGYLPKSPFWRVAKAVAGGLGIGGADWYRRIAYTNLYKVGRAYKGNPPDSVATAQMSVCTRLLRHEITVLSPRRVLFLVGCDPDCDWFQWFQEALSFDKAGEERGATYTAKWGSIGQSSVVVLPHPQGKPESLLAGKAVDLFRAFGVGATAL